MAVWAARLDLSCVALYLVTGGESLVEARSNLKLECLITLEKWKGQNRTGTTKSIEHLDKVQASVLTCHLLVSSFEGVYIKCSSMKVFALNSVVISLFSSFPPLSFPSPPLPAFFCLLLLLLPPLSCCLISYMWKLWIPSPLLPLSRLGCSPWVGIRIRPSEGSRVTQPETSMDQHWDGLLIQQPDPPCTSVWGFLWPCHVFQSQILSMDTHTWDLYIKTLCMCASGA